MQGYNKPSQNHPRSRLVVSKRRIHRWHSKPLCLSNASQWDWHHLAATQQGVEKVGFWQHWSQASPPEDLSNWSEQSTTIYSHLMMYVDRLLCMFTCFQSKNHSKYAVRLSVSRSLHSIFLPFSFLGLISISRQLDFLYIFHAGNTVWFPLLHCARKSTRHGWEKPFDSASSFGPISQPPRHGCWVQPNQPHDVEPIVAKLWRNRPGHPAENVHPPNGLARCKFVWSHVKSLSHYRLGYTPIDLAKIPACHRVSSSSSTRQALHLKPGHRRASQQKTQLQPSQWPESENHTARNE